MKKIRLLLAILAAVAVGYYSRDLLAPRAPCTRLHDHAWEFDLPSQHFVVIKGPDNTTTQVMSVEDRIVVTGDLRKPKDNDVLGPKEQFEVTVRKNSFSSIFRTADDWFYLDRTGIGYPTIRAKLKPKERQVLKGTWEDDPGLQKNSVTEKRPNQAPQHNAGSRPSSDDSSASETPSSLPPRG